MRKSKSEGTRESGYECPMCWDEGEAEEGMPCPFCAAGAALTGRTTPAGFIAGLPDFTDRAACREANPKLFFPGQGGSFHEGKQVCAKCEVIEKCRNYAVPRTELQGLWGGMTEAQRHKERRRLMIDAYLSNRE